MDVATGALESLIPKLRQLLHDEYILQTGVKPQVEYVSLELEAIHAALRRVASVPPDALDEQVRNWAREAREASYNMEDRLDAFLVSVDDGYSEPIEETGCWWLKRAKKKMLGDLRPSKGKDRVDFVAAIQDMVKQLEELAERDRRYHFDGILSRQVTSTSSAVDPRLPALYRNERELVGIDEAREEVLRMLELDQDDDNQRVKVVSIVGLPGVGKTTLAKAVYDRLHGQFDCSAFVSVSRNPDLKKVLRDILLELDEAKYRTGMKDLRDMEENLLINKIRGFLENKRYMVVIDDIWHVKDWEVIRIVLSTASNQSRIITTTRNHNVAWQAAHGYAGTTYRVKPLCHVNSEKLFYKRIFGGEGNCPNIKLAKVSDKILKKCGGLPLAIITVASVLASKPWEEWSEVYNSIVLRHGSNRYVDNMRRVLSFSFYDLPPHLRTCLLHLISIFPANCFIEKDFLIWKWVAEGLVHKERGMPLFEVGESYFDELVDRSMIQVPEEYNNKGRVIGCRVHPVLLSQIRAICCEESFCTVLEDEQHTSPAATSNSRRIAMHNSSIRNVGHNSIVPDEASMDMGKVRSFNASLCFVDGMPQLSSFQVLRVLALEYCPGMSTNHLEMIGNLVHLRYLGLVGAGVLELPEALGGLRFLQTLDLRETDVEQWPSTLSRLHRLMCLCVGRTRTVPEGIGSLRALEDLRLHLVSSCDSWSNLTAELGRLESLRVLVLGFEKMDDELMQALAEPLAMHHRMHRLEVYCNSFTAADDAWVEGSWGETFVRLRLEQLVLGGIWFPRLPSWIDRLDQVSHLHLGVKIMEDEHLKILGRLMYLRSLVLISATSGEQQQPITLAADPGSGDQAYWRLVFFSTNMPIKFESGGLIWTPMQRLEHLEFRVRVARIADSWLSTLANLPSLEKVTVVLDCRGASAAETEEAEDTLRRATRAHPKRCLKLEVTKEHGNVEVPLVEQFRIKDPRLEALRSEMEKMQDNRQVLTQPDNDSDDEITPAWVASQ